MNCSLFAFITNFPSTISSDTIKIGLSPYCILPKDLGILAKGTSRADMAYGNSIAREEAKNATQGILDKYSV